MLSVLRKKFKSDNSGIDSLELCLNKKHFLNYPKKITYEYNSRGFRDKEWPEDLSDVVWCVGDSFTLGIGQPFEETWPQLLEKKIGKRCLNLGEDGCSNDTISLRVKKIYDLYKPKLIIVMWSYLNRRRMHKKDVQYNKNTFGIKNDVENFVSNYKIANDLSVNIVNLLIPNALIDFNVWSPKIFKKFMLQNSCLNKKQIEKILIYKQIDLARDYHHFDVQTSQNVCDLVMQEIYNFDKS